jgi:hypothetical protein
MGCGVSSEMVNVVEAEWVPVHEGSMCIVDMRDGVAPPGSWIASRTNGHFRNPGDPAGSVGVVANGGATQGTTGAWHRAEAGSRTDS